MDDEETKPVESVPVIHDFNVFIIRGSEGRRGRASLQAPPAY